MTRKERDQAAVALLAALLSNPEVLKINLEEAPVETAKKVRRCIQFAVDSVRDLEKELLSERGHGKGVDLSGSDVPLK
ncbi:MAG: hypothetical protein ACR2JB_06760 [Bryobacteraceae bacterium]